MMGMFLTPEELIDYTGRKLKSKQIEALKRMGVPFRVNACGRPVVTTMAVEDSRQPPPKLEPQWEMPK